MKVLLAIVILTLFIDLPCFARLGETEDQCAARYGQPVHVSLEEQVYEKNDFEIRIQFIYERCAHIVFRKTSGEQFSESEIQTLLNDNSEGHKWARPFTEIKQWQRDDGASATYYHEGILDLSSPGWASSQQAAVNKKNDLKGF